MPIEALKKEIERVKSLSELYNQLFYNSNLDELYDAVIKKELDRYMAIEICLIAKLKEWEGV